jgi:hypothetical protein
VPITLNFSPKFWLNPPGSKMPKEMVHIIVRKSGTLQAKSLTAPYIVPGWKAGNGVYKGFAPQKGSPISIVRENVLGWCPRHVPVEVAFLFWSFLRFHESNGSLSIPKSSAAPDGYWHGLQIYSFMENEWKTWRAMDFVPNGHQFHDHNGVKLWP